MHCKLLRCNDYLASKQETSSQRIVDIEIKKIVTRSPHLSYRITRLLNLDSCIHRLEHHVSTPMLTLPKSIDNNIIILNFFWECQFSIMCQCYVYTLYSIHYTIYIHYYCESVIIGIITLS